MITKARQTAKDAALDLARRGFAVFPCKPKSKEPATANGFYDASSDPAIVEKLFAGKSNYNFGIATGPASRVWLLDEDDQRAGEVLTELEQRHGAIPRSLCATTGRDGGGKHRYFQYPAGVEIKSQNKIVVPGYGKLNLDVRGTGGYAIAPPSLHDSGRRYAWESDPDETQIVEGPSWLVEIVTGKYTAGDSTSNGTTPALTFTVGAGAVLDLATAPGASKGSRHDEALKLIGSAVGRGLDPCEVARQALDWGRRCSPPMADDEVLRIVGDLSQKQGTKIETAIRDEVEAATLPEPVSWPALDEDAYHGLAGEIVSKIEPQSEADPAAILAQLLVSFGNVVGRGPHFDVEGTSHRANIFATLVGSTARGRKGTSEGRTKQVLKFADEEWVGSNIKTGLVSGEGLIWNVRDPIYKTEIVKEKSRIVGSQEVLADPGVEDKRLLVVEPEFAAVLRVCKRETNTLSPTMRSAWDSGTLRTMAKNSPATATDAHVSIIGHITHEELRRSLDETDGFNGFANRFLWVAVRRSKLLPDGGADLDLSTAGAELKSMLDEARKVERMKRSPAAAKLWRKVYHDLANDNATGLLAAVTSRAEAQVLRLSMVYALLDGC